LAGIKAEEVATARNGKWLMHRDSSNVTADVTRLRNYYVWTSSEAQAFCGNAKERVTGIDQD
jgi:hypothetical protein